MRDNKARMGRSVAPDKAKDRLDIAEKTDGIAQNYEIEFFFQRQFMNIADDKGEFRVTCRGLGNHLRTDVNPHPYRWFQRCQKFSVTATEVENSPTRRYMRPHQFNQHPVIVAVFTSEPVNAWRKGIKNFPHSFGVQEIAIIFNPKGTHNPLLPHSTHNNEIALQHAIFHQF